MAETPASDLGAIAPAIFYRDAPAAIAWLQTAFGYEPVIVVPGAEAGTVAHSELRLGAGYVMVSTARPAEGMRSPLDVGGYTGGFYVVIDEVDAHCERARAAGATILREPEDQPYGGRDYTALDLEGHRWSFGTYRLGSS